MMLSVSRRAPRTRASAAASARARLVAPALVALVCSARAAHAAPTVWAIDDGEKIKRDATTLGFSSGADNPVWAPSQPIRLFAMRNETIAFQVVVTTDATIALDGVTVDLDSLAGPSGATIANAPGATDPTSFVGRRIERFVEHYFDITRASGSPDPGAALGWASGSGPAPDAWTGWVPDALIPVEVAPSWDPYPMHVAASSNAVVWIDVTVPRTQGAGLYGGDVVVKAAGQTIATLPVELSVAGATLPDRPIQTMLYYDGSELARRIGDGPNAEQHLWKLLHRHRLSPMHGATSAGDLDAHAAALDGTEYTAAHGYEGPGESLGDGILSIGTYGSLGAPSSSGLTQKVEPIANDLAGRNLFATTDVMLYAIDEDCSSSYGQGWKTLLAGSSDPNVKNVKVGWTCSTDPSQQPVDVPMVLAAGYDPARVEAARQKGKRPWIYNGSLPQTGAFLTDTAAVTLRAQGWIAAMAGIDRWFYWETTFWYDDNRGGHGAYDPFVTAETFHNGDGDYDDGDGVLLYPGKQVDVFTQDSVGLVGVIASIRLKELRRGIEDAGYYQMAHAADGAKAEAIAKGLLPKILSDGVNGQQPSWTTTGKPWFLARKALLALVPQQRPSGDDGGIEGGGAASGTSGSALADRGGCACHAVSECSGALWAAAVGLGALALLRIARARRR